MNEHECVAPTPSNEEIVEAVRKIRQQGSKATLSSVLLVLYHETFSNNYLADAQKKENFSRATNRALQNAKKAGLIKYDKKCGWQCASEGMESEYPNLYYLSEAHVPPLRFVRLESDHLREIREEILRAFSDLNALRNEKERLSGSMDTMSSLVITLATAQGPEKARQAREILANLGVVLP